MPSPDRTVHGRTVGGEEIVRYDRAGRWYLEPKYGKRTPVDVHEAARKAFFGEALLGLPGGTAFDAKVRRMQKSVADA